MLLGAADYYDSVSIERLGSISREFQTGLFRSDGTLAIGYPTDTGGQIAHYDSAFTPLPGTVDLDGSPIALFERENKLYVITYTAAYGLEVQEITE